MKTSVIMKRNLMGYEVKQNHKTEMLNANDLHKAGNSVRKLSGMSQKQIGSYFDLDSTSELIKELCIIDDLRLEDVKKSSRGKGGGTWIHPVIFIDMAMWYSPELKVRVLKWVQDGLLAARDNSGDSYKSMNSALNRQFPKEMANPVSYITVANQIAAACKVGLGKDRWEKATEEQLKKRDKIQETISVISDLCPNVGSVLCKAIEKNK